jgi:hypothetical protein
MQPFLDLFVFINCSTCFRQFLRPSSGVQNCTYSVRYCQYPEGPKSVSARSFSQYPEGPLSQYPEGLATGHLDTGFSWCHWVRQRMLRWFPPFQVASTCFSRSPPDFNSVVTNCLLSYYVKWPLPPADNPTAVNKYQHHHHVQDGLGLIPVPCILKIKLVPPSLLRSSYVPSSF